MRLATASTMQNLKSRFSGEQKIQALVQKVAAEKVASNAETAMVGILTSYASSRGLYQYIQTDASGGTIYTYGNAPTLANSDIRWRISAGAIMVSTDYGQTWNSAFSANGTAVMQSLYAVGINADYIEAGNLTLGGTTKNIDGNFYLKDAQGNLRVTMNKYGIFNGKMSINDTTNTGFYVSNDGLIIGDGDTERYARITPDGTVYIHDNPYYAGEGDYVEAVPSFIVEGINDNDNPGRLILSSSGIELEETINGALHAIASMSADGNVYVHGDYPAIGSGIGTEGYIKYMNIRVTSATYQYLGIELMNGFTFGVNVFSSDRRLKDDIKDSEVNALSLINNINHRSFKWRRNKAKNSNGYIAQELEEVIPEAVFEVEQGDGTELKQINASILIPYLSKAIQELSAKVDALEARLAELEVK